VTVRVKGALLIVKRDARLVHGNGGEKGVIAIHDCGHNHLVLRGRRLLNLEANVGLGPRAKIGQHLAAARGEGNVAR
jgi:hypothetical protein